MVKVGCCGFPCNRKEYFHKFKLVEVQQTFYQMPKLETAVKWRSEAPADFEFTLKAWQLITHPPTSPTYRRARIEIAPGDEKRYGFFQPTDEVRQAWDETKEFARALAARIIVFQCPPSFKETSANVNNLKRFFSSVRDSGFLFAWEPRGGWSGSVVKALCSELGLIHCVDPFIAEPVAGELRYFRLHGGPGYRHRYTEDELKWLKEKVSGKEAYVLFNNLNMYQDSLALAQLLHGKNE